MILIAAHQLKALIFQGYRWEVQMLPSTVSEQLAREIFFVQPLHYHDDDPGPFIIEPRKECRPVIGIDPLSSGMRGRLIRLQWVIDDDEVRAAPGQGAANRNRYSFAPQRRHNLRFRIPLRSHIRKNTPVPVTADNSSEPSRK